MPDSSYSLADLQLQRDALLAEIDERGHITKAEAREIAALRAERAEHLWTGAWVSDHAWPQSVAD